MMANPSDGHTPDHGAQHHRLLPDHGGQDHHLLPGSRPRQPGRRTTTHSPTMAAKTTAYCRAAGHGSEAHCQPPDHGGQDLLPGSQPEQTTVQSPTLVAHRIDHPGGPATPHRWINPGKYKGGVVLASRTGSNLDSAEGHEHPPQTLATRYHVVARHELARFGRSAGR